ncbi:SDR family oxidoreductase [Pseudomonas sp. NPDC088368]|uniref:SDR family oxidoreductase n=1 Tax=Pseudomonas sp. NPDC088368 TaxID=3364453 RepID=UPI0037FE89E3
MPQETAVIIGAGDALGSAIARRFAREGYFVCLARRTPEKLAALVEGIQSAGGNARAFGVDARKEDQVVEFFAQVEREIGPVAIVVFNIGANVQFLLVETDAQKYFKVWEMCAFAGFLTAREAAKVMLPRGRGSLIFTGATASVRGGKHYAAFSGGKHALRALAQSTARELGPQGIHVAHLVIDGSIDTEFIRTLFPERYELKSLDGILNPDHIAENYLFLHQQPRDAWTFEMDVRPYLEAW